MAVMCNVGRPAWRRGCALLLMVTFANVTDTGAWRLASAAPPLAGPQRAQRGREAGSTPFDPRLFNPQTFDPEKYFEQFFGSATEEQKEELARIEIPWEEERRLGQQTLQAFLAELREKNTRVLTRGPEVSYLQQLVSELKPLMRNARRYRSITVLVVDTDDTDARSVPGGTVIVFRGMLRMAQSEAALVSVLAHELSHMDHGHQLRYLKSMKLAQRTFSTPPGGMDWERMMGSTMFLAQTFARPFRPEEESEADADAVRWTYQLGYDPRELGKMFLRMEKKDDGRQATIPSFFRTHPYHRDRYEAVMTQYDELMRTDPRPVLYVGQKNLIEMVPRSKHAYAE